MNTIFGAVINENLNDEVIVTVIATGFEKPTEPLYHTYGEIKKERQQPAKPIDDDDDDDTSEIDIPPFLRNKKFNL